MSRYAYIESATGDVWSASSQEFTVQYIVDEYGLPVDTRRDDAPDNIQCRASDSLMWNRWNGSAYETIWDLRKLKDEKNYEIDMKTRAIIAAGVLYPVPPDPGPYYRFNLDVNDQSSWHARRNNLVDSQLFGVPIDFPMKIMTVHNEAYYIQDGPHLLDMYYKGFGQVAVMLEEGRALKAQVNGCTTKEQIDAIVDDRVVPSSE